MNLKRWFCTFGADPETNAVVGGWIVIIAETEEEARQLFKNRFGTAEHPYPCCGFYDEQSFKQTRMWTNGNFGRRCHGILKSDYVCVEE